MSHQQKYTVSPVVEGDVEAVITFLKRTFFVDEPMNKAVNLCSETESCPELEQYCMHSMLEGISVKATDSEGNIVGVLVNGICPLKEEEGDDMLTKSQMCTNLKFKKILYIVAQREQSKLWEKYPEEKSLVEVKVAATDPNWRQKGIMNELLRHTEKIAKERGIKLLRMDTSSAYSAKSAERLGFTCVYKARYTDIQIDGKPVIVPEPPHLEDRVYVKQLN